MSISYRPLKSLKEGCWFKLICGASYQHLPVIRNLALVYALAGADCIDVAADPAVVEAVREAFQVISCFQQSEALSLPTGISAPLELPLLMVSFSDGEDPHFRKATFNVEACPVDCSRPCEAICPAAAIAFTPSPSGVIADRCYGCGRCLPVCPIQHITTTTRATSVAAIAPQILHQVDAIELHTQVGRYDAFMSLWSAIRPYLSDLTLISISCPDHSQVIDYLWQLYQGIQPLDLPLIWQTDGRPMSGDIGKGTTHATIRFAQKVLRSGPPGFVQLAGGTNAHTVVKLRQLVTSSRDHSLLLQSPTRRLAEKTKPTFGGIAYGSFARHLMQPLLDDPYPTSSEITSPPQETLPTKPYVLNHLEVSPTQLTQAVQTAASLVAPLKAVQDICSMPLLQGIGGLLPSIESP